MERYPGRPRRGYVKPTLCVLQSRQDQQTDQGIEDAPGQMAVVRLVIPYRTGSFARGNGNVRMIELGRDELADLLHRHGQVRIA